jgi:hypothetical protein
MSSKTLVYPVWNTHIIQNWDWCHQNHLARIELDVNHWDIWQEKWLKLFAIKWYVFPWVHWLHIGHANQI